MFPVLGVVAGILAGLLGNAVKYSSQRERAVIDVEHRRALLETSLPLAAREPA